MEGKGAGRAGDRRDGRGRQGSPSSFGIEPPDVLTRPWKDSVILACLRNGKLNGSTFVS